MRAIRDRQWRRAQRERQIQRVKSWYKYRRWLYEPNKGDAPEEEYQQVALRNHSAPHPCSGWCCGNPRTHFGSHTIQEGRHLIDSEEMLEEAGFLRGQLPKFNDWW